MPLVPESYWPYVEDTYWGGHPVLNSGLLRRRTATDRRHQWWIPRNSSWHHRQHEHLRQWSHPVEAGVRALPRSTIFSTADSPSALVMRCEQFLDFLDASEPPDGHLSLTGASPRACARQESI